MGQGAKLPSPQERFELIMLALTRRQPVANLCRQAGVSRELFYRWINRVRQAGLTALAAKTPGPKEVSVARDVEAQLKGLKAKIEKLEEEKKSLHREKDHLTLVAECAQRIIKRRGWDPYPEPESKKNGMRTRKPGRIIASSGARSRRPRRAPRSSPGAGEFPAAAIGVGSMANGRRDEKGL